MVPGTIFVIEKVYQIVMTLSRNGRSWVTAGVILPSNVVSLIIKRPPGFNFEPGQYILINIPDIAVFEWHPFTISSAPEQDDVMSNQECSAQQRLMTKRESEMQPKTDI